MTFFKLIRMFNNWSVVWLLLHNQILSCTGRLPGFFSKMRLTWFQIVCFVSLVLFLVHKQAGRDLVLRLGTTYTSCNISLLFVQPFEAVSAVPVVKFLHVATICTKLVWAHKRCLICLSCEYWNVNTCFSCIQLGLCCGLWIESLLKYYLRNRVSRFGFIFCNEVSYLL